MIVPDLPPEEARPWIKEARKLELDTIFLVAPTSPPERIRTVNKYSRGFIYYVSREGVTGEQASLSADIADRIRPLEVHRDHAFPHVPHCPDPIGGAKGIPWQTLVCSVSSQGFSWTSLLRPGGS